MVRLRIPVFHVREGRDSVWCWLRTTFIGSVEHGLHVEWHLRMKFHVTGYFTNGERDGVWERSTQFNKLISRTVYHNGLEIYYRTY